MDLFEVEHFIAYVPVVIAFVFYILFCVGLLIALFYLIKWLRKKSK